MPNTKTRLRRLVWPEREGFRSRNRRNRPLAMRAEADFNDWLSSGNPFERIASKRTDELLWVGLDLDTLEEQTDDERFLMDQLLNNAADWGAKPFGIGRVGARWAPLPILEPSGSSRRGSSRSSSLKGGQGVRGSRPPAPDPSMLT
jgi:hypothetical protein